MAFNLGDYRHIRDMAITALAQARVRVKVKRDTYHQTTIHKKALRDTTSASGSGLKALRDTRKSRNRKRKRFLNGEWSTPPPE